MDYKELLKDLSNRHHTSPTEVDREIRNAIKEAGFQMSAEEFIAMASKNVCHNLQRNQQM